MLLFSSLHIHPDQALTQDECTDCVAHHCGGHIGQQTLSFDDCVLCQFLTLSFVAVACVSLIAARKSVNSRINAQQCHVSVAYHGIVGLRAPPAFSI